MHVLLRPRRALKYAALSALVLMAMPCLAAGKDPSPQSPAGRQLRIPSRPSTPLFQGKQGKQKTEIHFDPATRVVTLKLLVQDPNGYFIPNLRPENFVVYDNGARPQNVSVDVEHAPVSLALLMEFGGRSPGMNRALGQEVSRAAQQLVDELGKDDKLAIWRYSDKVEKLADFTQSHDSLTTLLLTLGTPDASETNLYDAIVFMVGQMQPVQGRKAIVLLSSGIDTFSKARWDDALNAAANSDTPIYAVGLSRVLRDLQEMQGTSGPISRMNWKKADRELQEIARASGGRAYIPDNTLNLSNVYDDMLENLKLRYVVRYQLPPDAELNLPHTVRVELVDPQTGGPLQIVDSNGRPVRAKAILQDSYVPAVIAGR